MKRLLVELEKFMRWLSECTPEERRANDSQIQEMAQVLTDQLQPLNDRLELEDDDDSSTLKDTTD
ncbi:hypothetical protein [Rhodopirellula sallentina]|uniref:Uncharacterized protein n=1 Tax=Rhodopirellula sallentina SM41 TaxID=1263870 RepID=M5TTT4_9BACT|nr:hypothetical protein [Rhodopirellula sallentina]EMI52464.1 hypothetical protein RSSM_06087 [Rhodopirellula sallentina SM41]